MAVTKSWEHRTAIAIEESEGAPRERRRELPWLIGSSVILCAGLLLTILSKTQDFPDLEASSAVENC